HQHACHYPPFHPASPGVRRPPPRILGQRRELPGQLGEPPYSGQCGAAKGLAEAAWAHAWHGGLSECQNWPEHDDEVRTTRPIAYIRQKRNQAKRPVVLLL